MNKIIKTITPGLHEIFEKYKSSGIKAIYLWGSIITSDYNRLKSDIDSIAIVDDNFEPNLETKIQIELQNKYPKTNKFGFRILYEKELRTGIHFKSNIGSLASPRILLFDINNWLHIVGHAYSITDLTDIPPTVHEVLQLTINQITDRYWLDANKIMIGQEQYYIKCLWRIIYLLQISRGFSNPFSYSSVLSYANDSEKITVTVLQKIKDTGYTRNSILENSTTLNDFTRKILKS